MANGSDERVLVLTPTTKEGDQTWQVLLSAGFTLEHCPDLRTLCREIQAGAAVALLTEEFIEADRDGCLKEVIEQQPAWSDFPLIVLAHEGDQPGIRHWLNATFVEQPVRVRSLLSVIQAALRTRRHQYKLRDELEQRKQAEIERSRLMETLQLTIAAGDFGMWDWEPDTDRMILSKRAAEIYGVEPGGYHQREPMRALLHPDYRDKARDTARRAIQNRTDYEIEYPILRLDGSLVWASARGRGVYDEGGNLRRTVGIVQDITQRKLAEENLRQSDERHRFLSRLAEVTQALVDPNEVMALSARLLAEHLSADRCAYADVEDEQTFIIIGDYSVNVPSIVGRWPVNAFGTACTRHMLANEPFVVNDAETDPRITANDIVAYRATNVRAVICVPLHKEGRFTAAMAIHQTTPRFWQADEIQLVSTVVARCWEALERARVVEQLRDADRKKDDFIALLAHELRNPLAPVRNGLQILHLATDQPEVARAAREMMDRQLGHMVRLIDDLLDVSRISRNKMELRRDRVTLSEVIQTAVETARPAIDMEAHDLEIFLPAEPIVLDADLTRLAQVFSNLLTNSAKYTPRGGHIGVSAELQGDEVLVSVKDNGIGIPLASQGHIFEMFSQVDRASERSVGGLGIGLALVKGLVEMHGGKVTVHSAGSDHGSEFLVTLPILSRPDDSPANPLLRSAKLGAGLRVLVVDDNRDGAMSMAMMLELLGVETRTAYDGVEALQMTESFRPQVILMDVGMPRMDGYEATRQIRRTAGGQNLRVVALTGWGQDNDRHQSREAGCDAHLVKPVELDDLKRVLLDFGFE